MSVDEKKPKYQHDCDHCTFLGQWSGIQFDGCDHETMDLYNCGDSTVIARFGNDGPEYTSGLCFAARMNAALGEAKRRAEANGVDFRLLHDNRKHNERHH